MGCEQKWGPALIRLPSVLSSAFSNSCWLEREDSGVDEDGSAMRWKGLVPWITTWREATVVFYWPRTPTWGWDMKEKFGDLFVIMAIITTSLICYTCSFSKKMLEFRDMSQGGYCALFLFGILSDFLEKAIGQFLLYSVRWRAQIHLNSSQKPVGHLSIKIIDIKGKPGKNNK